jgi:pimeloyl-ACP methyl ester carboxylesterase
MRQTLLFLSATVAIFASGLVAYFYTPDKPRAALEAKYASSPSVFLLVEGVRLHLRDTGPRDAPVLILLHGFGASLHTWDSWAQRLDHDYRVVRIDLPGFALTGPDPTGDYTDERSIEVVRSLMDRLEIAKASIAGHSMGGRLSWKFAARHPERVDKLILIAPDGFVSPGKQYRAAPQVPLTSRLLPYFLPTALVRASLEPAYVNRAAITDEQVMRYRDLLLAPGVRRAILQRMAQNVLVEPEPLLRLIQAPTILLWGERDAMVPFTNAGDYQRAIENVQLVSFPDLGHLLQEEAPARTVKSVQAFMSSIKR